jgi:hypothetical protein
MRSRDPPGGQTRMRNDQGVGEYGKLFSEYFISDRYHVPSEFVEKSDPLHCSFCLENLV